MKTIQESSPDKYSSTEPSAEESCTDSFANTSSDLQRPGITQMMLHKREQTVSNKELLDQLLNGGW